MADIIGLHHIGVKVSRTEVSVDFYNRLLGFEKTASFEKDGTRLTFMQKGTCVLELIEKPVAEELPAGRVDHVALTVNGIHEIVEMLKDAHVEFETTKVGYADWIFDGVENIFFRGPDGERIELFELK